MSGSNGDNGRGPDGKFGPGNSFGRGNPHYNQVKKYRDGIRKAFGVKAVVKVLEKLRQLALDGDTHAARLFLSYVAGVPARVDEELIAELEQRIDDVVRHEPDPRYL